MIRATTFCFISKYFLSPKIAQKKIREVDFRNWSKQYMKNPDLSCFHQCWIQINHLLCHMRIDHCFSSSKCLFLKIQSNDEMTSTATTHACHRKRTSIISDFVQREASHWKVDEQFRKRVERKVTDCELWVLCYSLKWLQS